MLRLPPELEPWEPYLRLFDVTLAPALGRVADEVLRALVRLGARQPHQGEPSGWAGLDRRGPFERLLSTDWALAELAPDEFLRRATQGELLFWQRERAASPLGGTSRLLLDCGPYQVGACRVVQLALLVVMARRAAEAGRRFAWCVGQQPEQEFVGLSLPSVQAFLKGRSAGPVFDEAVRQFRQRAEPEDELWLAGSPRFLSRHQGHHFALELEQTGPGEVRLGKARLRLPGPEAVGLLRDPFRKSQAEPLRGAPAGDFVFSSCGRRLIVRAPGEVVVYPLPNSPRDPGGPPRRHPIDPSRVVVAVGMHRRELLVMEAGRGELRFRAGRQEIAFPAATGPVGPLGELWLEPPERSWLEAELDLPSLARWSQSFSWKPLRLRPEPTDVVDQFCRLAPRLWMVLDGSLFMSHPSRGLVRMAPVRAHLGSHFVVVGRKLCRTFRGQLETLRNLAPPVTEDERQPLLLGFQGRMREPLVAVHQDDCWWSLHPGTFRHQAEKVQAIAYDVDHWRGPALATLRDSSVHFLGDGWQRSVPFSGPLQEVAFSPSTPRFAYRTRGGELGVYSMPHQRILLRLLP